MGTTGLVAILFTDMVGSTETVARLGEERAEQLRQTHFALLREGISEHAGTEVKNLGDGLMVAFGAASDAVACAVAMQQAVERQNRRAEEALAMRVGVAVGEATRDDSDYFGTPVIEAARLCARAEGRQILVTEMARALTGSRGGHHYESLGPMELKGLPEALSVHQVRWETLADAAPPLPARLAVDRSLAFIGRAGEREVLERAWKQAEQGAPQVVLVAGEPGIGKTRLATETALHAHRQGALVLLGTCDEDLAVPYQPFVDALRHLMAVCPDYELADALAERGGELTRLLPELGRRVPGLPSPQGGDPETERYLLFSAVVGLLGAVSRWRPVVLLLDDLHWATKPTLLLLKHLIRSGEPMALLIVGTYRDSDVGRGHPLTELLAELRRERGVERLGLRGLSDGEAVTMMETLAGHDLEGGELALAHAVYAEADGSPFFMRELLRHFIEAGDLVQEAERWTFRGEVAGIPDSVREVIGHRLSRLPEPVDRLLTLAAVIGREFDVAVLGRLASLDDSVVVEALAEARQAALVREVKGSPGRFTFVHALIRHTIYDELGPARRIELHRRVAETVESLGQGDAHLADLAHHWLAATPVTGVRPDDVVKAARYAEQAGRRAMASLAYEEAANHFEGALRAARQAGDGAQISELLIVLGEAQRCTGDPAHRETLLEAGRLAHEQGDTARAARAALANQRGVFSRIGAVDHDRVAALERALEAVGPAVTPMRACLLAGLATELHFEGDERRLELAREALAIAGQLGNLDTLAQALAALWLAAWGNTVQGERASIAADLNAVARQSGDRTLQFHAGAALFLTASGTGEMELADRGLADCVRIAEELGQPVLRWRAAYLQAHHAIATGRFDEVERWANESLRLGEIAGQPDAMPFAHSPLSVLRLLQGRFEEANDLIRPVIEQFPGAVVFSAALAWSLSEQGRVEEAKAILDRFQAEAFAELPRDYTRLLILVLLSRACSQLEDPDVAAELYELLFPSRAAMATVQAAWLGPVTHDLGLLATVLERYEDAEEHFAEAVEVQDRMGAQGTVVHTRLAWAHMLLRRAGTNDASKARTLLAEAKAGAREINIPAIEARIDDLLAHSPDSQSARPPGSVPPR